MTVEEVYEALIVKSNENSTTDKTALDRGRAAIIFNEASIRFVEWVLEKRNEDDIRYIRPLLTTTTLTKKKIKDGANLFKLPENYFDLGSATCKATKGECSDVEIELFEIKIENLPILKNNEFFSPSFEYREAPFYLEESYIKVITENSFDITSLRLSYYKYPQKIELENIEDPDSKFKNANTPLELDDRALFRIINIANSLNSQNTNPTEFQKDKLQVSTKF